MKKLVILSIAFAAVLSQSAVMANETDELVEGYVKSPYGEVYKNSYGECWRTRFKDTTEKLEECGYAKEIVATQELVLTETAATLTTTVAEEINIRAALLFAFDSDVLSNDAKAVIDDRTAKYREKGRLTSNVEVIGHTDSTGTEAYNQDLSERRARSVARYLEANTNITDDNINTSGRGETEPTASNATREGRAANRRVIIILNGELD